MRSLHSDLRCYGGERMGNSNDAKRAAFMQRIKVNAGSQQQDSAKRAQVSSNNASNSGNKGEAPQRQRAVAQGRGNER
mgnify:FL=1